MGGNLLNKIWLPNSEISNKVNRYVNQLFRGYLMIGIQLRYFYINDVTDTKNFLNCARQIEDNLTAQKILNRNKKVKWFVTSDNEEMLHQLNKTYPDKVIISEGALGHVFYDLRFYPRTILDLELLSKCDELVLTGGSTYGFLAAMKSFKMPYYINGGDGNMNKCVRMSLGSPSTTPLGRSVF